MKNPLLTVLTFALAATLNAAEKPLFSNEEILDESTLDIKILEDWHPVGSTRQMLIEINVAEWLVAGTRLPDSGAADCAARRQGEGL